MKTETGLDHTKAEILESNFSNIVELIDKWKERNDRLIITDESQKAEILMAKDGYKYIKNVRVEIEKTRKSLKEDSLKEGRAIDLIAKTLTEQISPLENELERKAKFVEIAETERRLAITYARLQKASHLGFVIAQTGMIIDMSDEMFDIYLRGLKSQAEKREAEEKAAEMVRMEAEAEKVEKIRLEAEEWQAKIAENFRLKAEAEAENRAREKTEAEQRRLEYAPDIIKLQRYITQLRSVPVPELSDPQEKNSLYSLRAGLKELLDIHY